MLHIRNSLDKKQPNTREPWCKDVEQKKNEGLVSAVSKFQAQQDTPTAVSNE